MKTVLSALVSLSLMAGLAGVAASPAAAEQGYTNKKKKKHARYRYYRGYDNRYYYERWADRLPIGTNSWWYQMDTEQRGGRR